jgi:hypothetical protein
MNVELVRWGFRGLSVPMIAVGSVLVCTNKQIGIGLGCGQNSLWNAYNQHREEMDELRYTNRVPKEFLTAHKAELGIDRLREDLTLWTEDAMINFAFYIRSPQAVAFRTELRRFVKENRSVNTVPRADHDALRSEFHEFKSLVLEAIPSINKTASLAGAALAAQKGIRHLRLA